MGIPRHGEAQSFDDYLLPDHWCFHVYSYHATLELDGEPYAIHPGCASIVPSGVRMLYRYQGVSEHVYFHFRPNPSGQSIEIPMVFDLGDRYNAIDSLARKAVGQSMLHPSCANATLWSFLWEFYVHEEAHVQAHSISHPLVQAAVQHIEQRLGGQLSVAQLCKEVGVSYGYLSRIFNAHLGKPVSEYIRSRRADNAEHLLCSTTLPIKVIARTIGIPDLQQFNRLMHEYKGASPRAIRRGAFPDRPYRYD